MGREKTKALLAGTLAAVLLIGNGFIAAATQGQATESAAKAAESTAKATESTAKATESATKTTESTTKTTESAAKATESAAKATESATKAAESTTKATESATKTAESAAKQEEADSSGLKLGSPSAILIEGVSGNVLYQKDPDLQRAPASITKVMTLLLAFEAIERGELSMDEMLTASDYACSMGGSQIWLEPGEQMSVDDLLKATAVGSANDAAVVLAERLGGTEGAFVEKMNQRAAALSMNNTQFRNCNGLDEEGHFTTARDIATLSMELLHHQGITAYTTIWMDELRGGETELVNTNKLVYHYTGTTGLKTGGTDKAGLCLAASATRQELPLISVVLGATSSDMQFGDSRALLDFGFSKFVNAPVVYDATALEPLAVQNGIAPTVPLVATPPERLVVRQGEEMGLVYETKISQTVRAPIMLGQTLGKVTVKSGEEELLSFPIQAAREVEEINFPRALSLLWGRLVSL